MDINEALDTLNGAILTRQKEIDAMTLAVEILSDTFAAEFKSRDDAIAQLATMSSELADESAAGDDAP